MPLKAPRRLPKNLRREVSPATRQFARRYHDVGGRRSRRRKEAFVRFTRKAAKVRDIVFSEFRVWTLFAVFLTTVLLVLVLLFAPFFDVREIRVRRQDPRIDPEEIQETLSPLFNQRLVLVTRGQVESMLLAASSDITKVEIGKEYPSTLTVTVYVEPVVAEVTIDEPGSGSGVLLAGSGAVAGRYSYVTASGLFVESAVKLTTSSLPTLTITDWTVRPENRRSLLSKEFLQNVFLARDVLRRDFGLTAKSTTVFLRAQEFHVRTDKTTLWFDLRSSLPVQFQRFRTLLKTVSLDQVKEYIDLRIADRIIYK